MDYHKFIFFMCGRVFFFSSSRAKVPYFCISPEKLDFCHFLEISSEWVKIAFFFPALIFFPPLENEWVSEGLTFPGEIFGQKFAHIGRFEG